jgi:hypothetical protein
MLGWDRNPLRRRTDRVEAAMVAGLVVGSWPPRRCWRGWRVTGPGPLAGVLTASVLGFMCVLAGGAGRILVGRRRLADWTGHGGR